MSEPWDSIDERKQTEIDAQRIADAAGPIVPVNCASCEHRKDLEARIGLLAALIELNNICSSCGDIRDQTGHCMNQDCAKHWDKCKE